MTDTRTILRGQIYHINLDPEHNPIGSEEWPDRPGIIVSNDINNKYANVVEVVYLTTKLKRKVSPTHVKVRPKGRTSLALCEQVHSVDRSRLGAYIDTLSPEDIERIDDALACSLGITPDSPHIANLFHKWELYINRYNLEIGMHLQTLLDEEQAARQAIVETIDTKQMTDMEQELALLKLERDSYKKLLDTTQRRLELAREECDQYQRLYEGVRGSDLTKTEMVKSEYYASRNT